MIVHISDQIRIRGTQTCYQLERKHQRNGLDDWKPFKYYIKFADAAGEACEREIRTHPAHGLAEAIEVAYGVARQYGELLDGALEELSKRSETLLRAAS